MNRRVAGEQQHVPDDGIETIDGVRDLFAEFGLLGSLGQILRQHLHVQLDRGEGIADLVSDPRGHLSQRRQRSRPAKLRIGLGQLALEMGDLAPQRNMRLLQPVRRLVDRAHQLLEILEAYVRRERDVGNGNSAHAYPWRSANRFMTGCDLKYA